MCIVYPAILLSIFFIYCCCWSGTQLSYSSHEQAKMPFILPGQTGRNGGYLFIQNPTNAWGNTQLIPWRWSLIRGFWVFGRFGRALWDTPGEVIHLGIVLKANPCWEIPEALRWCSHLWIMNISRRSLYPLNPWVFCANLHPSWSSGLPPRTDDQHISGGLNGHVVFVFLTSILGMIWRDHDRTYPCVYIYIYVLLKKKIGYLFH